MIVLYISASHYKSLFFFSVGEMPKVWCDSSIRYTWVIYESKARQIARTLEASVYHAKDLDFILKAIEGDWLMSFGEDCSFVAYALNFKKYPWQQYEVQTDMLEGGDKTITRPLG